MTVQEIKQRAEAYIGTTLTNDQAITAINEAMAVLGDAAEVYDSLQVTTTQENQWVTLPAQATSVVRVEDELGEPASFVRMAGRVRLRTPGTYTVWYRRMPNPVAALTDTPEVHVLFHQALVTYVIGWFKLQDDEENPDGKAHMQQFAVDARAALAAIRRQRGPRAWRVER